MKTVRLSNTRIAFPFDVRHLAQGNVSFERSEAADAGFPSAERHFVVTGR